MKVPEDVEYIIDELNLHGWEAYAVGGCVRDTLLGRTPGDWDITTSAKPEQVKELFRKTIDTGIQHGTVTVLLNREGYEVTTYRIDGEYEDGRHPKQVEYTNNLLEDLKRRDFTINAMAYSRKNGIVDAFGGIKDLEHKIIRCVGTPADRFTEDALRILRALRFSAQLDFEIEEDTKKAVTALAHNLVHVSKERIQTELTKLLVSGHPEKIYLVFEMGVSPWISETFSVISGEEVDLSSGLPAAKHMRWAAFMRNHSAEEAAAVLKELKMDNETIIRVSTLVEWGSKILPRDKPGIRKVMSQLPKALYEDLLTFKMYYAKEEELAGLHRIQELSEEIRKDGDCLSLKELAVNGGDLIRAGVRPGKDMGDMLHSFLELVLVEPEKNTKEYLLSQIG